MARWMPPDCKWIATSFHHGRIGAAMGVLQGNAQRTGFCPTRASQKRSMGRETLRWGAAKVWIAYRITEIREIWESFSQNVVHVEKAEPHVDGLSVAMLIFCGRIQRVARFRPLEPSDRNAGLLQNASGKLAALAGSKTDPRPAPLHL